MLDNRCVNIICKGVGVVDYVSVASDNCIASVPNLYSDLRIADWSKYAECIEDM